MLKMTNEAGWWWPGSVLRPRITYGACREHTGVGVPTPATTCHVPQKAPSVFLDIAP